MSEQAEEAARPAGERDPVRFEATLHPRAEGADLRRVADLDVDRVPDPAGDVRVLVDVDECRRLLDSGFEVRLQRAVPVHPLDAGMVASEDDARGWLEQRVRDAGGAG